MAPEAEAAAFAVLTLNASDGQALAFLDPTTGLRCHLLPHIHSLTLEAHEEATHWVDRYDREEAVSDQDAMSTETEQNSSANSSATGGADASDCEIDEDCLRGADIAGEPEKALASILASLPNLRVLAIQAGYEQMLSILIAQYLTAGFEAFPYEPLRRILSKKVPLRHLGWQGLVPAQVFIALSKGKLIEHVAFNEPKGVPGFKHQLLAHLAELDRRKIEVLEIKLIAKEGEADPTVDDLLDSIPPDAQIVNPSRTIATCSSLTLARTAKRCSSTRVPRTVSFSPTGLAFTATKANSSSSTSCYRSASSRSATRRPDSSPLRATAIPRSKAT